MLLQTHAPDKKKRKKKEKRKSLTPGNGLEFAARIKDQVVFKKRLRKLKKVSLASSHR